MSQEEGKLHFGERIAGKWQIPCLFVGLLLLGYSLVRLRPVDARLDFEAQYSQLQALIEGGLYPAAVEGASAMLMDPELLPEQESRLHLTLARALFLRAEEKGLYDSQLGEQIVGGFQRGEAGGTTLTPDDRVMTGRAYEWQREYFNAVAMYELAVDGGVRDALSIRKRILQLETQYLEVPAAELHAAFDEFIEDVRGVRLDLLQWAVRHKVEMWSTEDNLDQARALVERLRPDFEGTDFREAFEYLVALLLYRSEQYDEAEAALRGLRDRLKIKNEVDAQSGWLLGRVILADGGPQRPAEALSFFRDVIASHATGEYVLASRLGLAEAFCLLNRYADGLGAYRQVVGDLERFAGTSLINPDVVRVSLTTLGETLAEREQFAEALAFTELASQLIDPNDDMVQSLYLEQLAKLKRSLGRQEQERANDLALPGQETLRDRLLGQAREHFVGGAEDLIELGKLNVLSEGLSADAFWRAAGLLDDAGERDRVIEILTEFIKERPDNAMTPLALYRLAQALQATGAYEDAVARYQEIIERFPRTEAGRHSLVPLADCFMALEGREVEAEGVLLLIVEAKPGYPPMFTPAAPEFREAVFKLGDLYSRISKYEEAVARLEEALSRYPDDPRVTRARFLLGDAYRQSAAGLAVEQEKATNVVLGDHLAATRMERLRTSAGIFDKVVRGLHEKQEGQELSRLEALDLKYARLYLPDCLYDLGEYAAALELYEQAAWTYQDDVAALAAHVQIVNCYQHLGREEEAAAALERATWLTRKMPDEAFPVHLPSQRREDWEKFFNWVAIASRL